MTPQAIVITGAARRVGASIARVLHGAGMNILLHYRSSAEAAQLLRDELEAVRPNSVQILQADLRDLASLPKMIERAAAQWGQLTGLVNNASTFYPTPLGTVTTQAWDDLIGTNLQSPFFLSQAALPWLRASRGCIVNLVDIYADRPLKNHSVYNIAKAGLVMLTKTLAQEYGPEVRVNAVAPGAILWPEQPIDPAYQANRLERTALQRLGSPLEVAQAVRFLIQDAPYTTGHVLTVDGGRSVAS